MNSLEWCPNAILLTKTNFMGYPEKITIELCIANNKLVPHDLLVENLSEKLQEHTFITLFFISFFLFCQTGNAQTNSASRQPVTQSFPADLAKGTMTYGFVPSINQTWGFQIQVNQKPFIKQLSIPAVQGNQGFKDTTAAGKVARLMIRKMKQGDMPPTITIQEMKKIKAI